MWGKFSTYAVTTLLVLHCITQSDAFRIGVGRADCTGPPAEIVFMGYAQLSQRGNGIHLRQFSRAFIAQNDNDDKRVVFVTVDAGMIGHGIRRDVVERLQQKYGNLYTLDNVAISGTHTHAGPGGYLMHLLYDISILGFVAETYYSLVDGIFNSIDRAHQNLQYGRIYMSQREVFDAQINRSPTSYLGNPEEERAQYDHNTDRTLTQLRFVSDNNEILGVFNWFAVHPTSMNNTNHLVSSDNVGYSAVLLEKDRNHDSVVGQGSFVGGFAAANLGDISPNIMGAKCEYTGESCDIYTSTCPADAGRCFASGPGGDMIDSTKIIGERIYEVARDLLNSEPDREVTGEINYVHQFVDMPTETARYFNPKTRNTENVRGCLTALGYSFAAGTTDGPGAFDFEQGTTTGNEMWDAVRDFLAEPTQDDIDCHFPKPILLMTGRAHFPFEWQPRIVPVQILQVGDVALAAMPGEFTTMSGRRIRKSVQEGYARAGVGGMTVISAGMSNMYTSYVTTPEEYVLQRYEAASTIFGPHTLVLYQNKFEQLAEAMVRGNAVAAGPTPPFLDDYLLTLNTPVFFDGTPAGDDFGDVRIQPNGNYRIGETVYSKFVAGNPRNDLRHDASYLTVEMLQGDGSWKIVKTDGDFDTKFHWESTSLLLGHSDVEITWTIGQDTQPGTYRIRHWGANRNLITGVRQYMGQTNDFNVSY